jgi:hypothetical protein
LAKITTFVYVAACLVAMVLRPTTFLSVSFALVLFYHWVLIHAAFLEVVPTLRLASGGDGHPLLRAYRRASPVLAITGFVLLFVPLPALGAHTPGVLVAAGTGFILAVRMITFAGTDAG